MAVLTETGPFILFGSNGTALGLNAGKVAFLLRLFVSYWLGWDN